MTSNLVSQHASAEKKPPNLITMPAWRQVICSNPPWNCFCPPSPKTSLLLFPCSKSVFLVVYNEYCSVLTLFLISSGVLIFYSSGADRPLLLATIFTTPLYNSRKLFKRCLKYFTLRWISQVFSQTKAHSQLRMQPSNLSMFTHQLHTHTKKTHCLLRLSNKPKWQNAANKALTIPKRKGTLGIR